MNQDLPLPQSPEAERAVLAAVLLDPEACLPLVRGVLRAGHFFLERHRILFKTFLALEEGKSPIDLRTVQASLEDSGRLQEAGGLAYLASLDAELPDLSRVEAYATIVRERAGRRQAISLASAVVRDAFSGEVSAAELQEQLQAAGTAVGESGTRRLLSAGEALEDALDEICRRDDLQNDQQHGRRGLSTPFAELDRLTGGFRRGWQVIVAGRPGMGKTTLGLNLAEHWALYEGAPGLIFSLEMTPGELSLKMLSARSGVPQRWLADGLVQEDQWEGLVRAVDEYSQARLDLDPSPRLTLGRCEALCRAQAARGLRWVVIDYLGLMDFSGSRRHELVAEASRRLKLLARELGLTTLILSQLNRESERRKDPRPTLADLRESGAVEQDADVVLFPFRPELYTPEDPTLQGRAELILAKNRHGQTGTIQAKFQGHLSRFRPFGEEVES